MSGVSQFYLFITKRGGFEQFKRDADTNHNNTVQFNELYNYIQKEPTLVPNVSTEDMYTIWKELDLDIYGTNSDSTDHVSENGSLSNSEEIKFNRRIEIYGELSEKICNIISETIDNDAFSRYNINRNTLEANIIDEVLLICGNDIEQVSQYIKTDESTDEIRKHTFQQALYCVRDDVCNNMQGYVAGMEYDFDEDQDLKEIIDRYISGYTTTQGCNLTQVVDGIEQIIGAYLNTAELNVGNYQAPEGFAYDPNSKMNTVQLATLRKYWNDIINNIPADQYREFASDLYDAAIEGFISKKSVEWAEMNSSQFASCKKSASEITSEFTNSPEMNTLSKIVEINNICDEAGSYEGEWSDFYDGDNDPKRIASMLFYFGSFYPLNKEMFADFFNNGLFTEYLKDAYTDIISDPEKYDLDLSTCSQQEIQNAVLRYFKEHISSILLDLGCNNSETTNALAFDFYGTYDIVKNNKTAYGDYDFEDLKASARQLVNYVKFAYQSIPAVMEAITELELDNIESFDSPQELNESIKSLMEVIRVEASAIYHRLDPTKTDAIIETVVKNVLDTKGVTDENQRRICGKWLRNIAGNYLNDYKGYRLDVFQTDLTDELNKWFDSPMNTLVSEIDKKYWNDIKDNDYTNCTKEDLAELRKALIGIMELASCLGVRLVDLNGNEITPENFANSYGTSEANELLKAIENIRALLKTISGNMESIADKYKGHIDVYIYRNTDSLPKFNTGSIDTDTGIPDGSTVFTNERNARARIRRHLEPRLEAEARRIANQLGIPSSEIDKLFGSGDDDMFEACLRKAVDDKSSHFWLGGISCEAEKAAEQCTSDFASRFDAWTKEYLENHATIRS